MANICSYKIKVKGKKNACYAFMGSTSAYDDRDILLEAGTEDDFVLIFKGTCKWGIDMYCHDFEGKKPVILPNNFEDALDEAEDKYWYHTVQERSEMFNVEVWCNSGDTEDLDEMIEAILAAGDITIEDLKNDPDLSPYLYEHYNCGEEIIDDIPNDIRLPFSFNEYLEEFDSDDYDEDDY